MTGKIIELNGKTSPGLELIPRGGSFLGAVLRQVTHVQAD